MKLLFRVVFVVAMGVAVLAAAQPRARVEFRSDAEVAPGVVRLSDVADVSGDSALVSRLNNLEVGRVDKPGRVTRVTANVVKGFYVRSVVDPALVEFVGEGPVTVKAIAAEVDSDSLLSLLHAAVSPRMDGLREGKDWELVADRLPKFISVPVQGASVQIELSPRFSGRGQETAAVLVFADGKMLSRQQIAYQLKRWEDLVVLRNALRKGEEVRAEDVELQREETTFQQRKVIRNLSEAIGRRTVRQVRADDLLVDNWLETPYAVRAGDRIRLLVKIGDAVVQTAGVAKESAFRGQSIAVENADSRKILQAKVSDVGEAWIVN